MNPIQLRVCQIFDFGSLVSIVGFDTEANAPLVVHVDHRPIQAIWAAWREAGLPKPVLYKAERLTIELALRPNEGHGDG